MKIGKTTLACQFPKNLLCGFEHGWNAISGAMAQDIMTWADFKTVVKQLGKSQAKEMFETVTIDTVGRAWDMCMEYICDQEGVDKISDIPYGAGYAACKKEFENMLYKITQLGYGIVIIAHPKTRQETDGSNTIEIVAPDIPERAKEIVNRLVDIIGYIYLDTSTNERFLYTRSTKSVMAGSRFQYLPAKIPLGYQELVDAIGDAIDEAEKNGAVVNNAPIIIPEETKIDFKEVKTKIGKIARALSKLDDGNEDGPYMAKYKSIVDNYLGKGKLVKDCDEMQSDILGLILEDLQEFVAEKELDIKV